MDYTYKFNISGKECAFSTILFSSIKMISKTTLSYSNYTREHCILEISICMIEAWLCQKYMSALKNTSI